VQKQQQHISRHPILILLNFYTRQPHHNYSYSYNNNISYKKLNDTTVQKATTTSSSSGLNVERITAQEKQRQVELEIARQQEQLYTELERIMNVENDYNENDGSNADQQLQQQIQQNKNSKKPTIDAKYVKIGKEWTRSNNNANSPVKFAVRCLLICESFGFDFWVWHYLTFDTICTVHYYCYFVNNLQCINSSTGFGIYEAFDWLFSEMHKCSPLK